MNGVHIDNLKRNVFVVVKKERRGYKMIVKSHIVPVKISMKKWDSWDVVSSLIESYLEKELNEKIEVVFRDHVWVMIPSKAQLIKIIDAVMKERFPISIALMRAFEKAAEHQDYDRFPLEIPVAAIV